MKRISSLLSVGVVLAASCLLVPELRAVWFDPVGVGAVTGLGGFPCGFGYGGYGYGGGTVAGSYLQGMSQVVAAQGQYNEATAKAAISYEEARTKYIDNSKLWTDTYFK